MKAIVYERGITPDISELPVMLDDGAIIPTRAHDLDGGLDLYNRNENVLVPGASWDDANCTGDCGHCSKSEGFFADGKFVLTNCKEYYDHCGFAIIDTGVQYEILGKSGAWFSYNGEKIAQGREKLRQILRENTELRAEIEQKIREAAKGSNNQEEEETEE